MKDRVYAQLYSINRHNPVGVLNALKTISEIGYDGVELLRPATEGLSNAEFKKYLEDLNLKVISAMMVLDNDENIAFCKDLGIEYVVGNCNDQITTMAELLAECKKMNEIGKKYAELGFKYLVHNHSLEFRKVSDVEEDILCYDVYIQNTDPAYVNFQLDVGWALFAGVDTVEYVKKNAGRFPIIHVKDCDRVAKDDEEKEHFPKRVLALGPPKINPNGSPEFSQEQQDMLYNARNFNCSLGKGLIDWKKMVDVCDAQGTVAYVSEREYYHIGDCNGDLRLCAIEDYEFMRSL